MAVPVLYALAAIVISVAAASYYVKRSLGSFRRAEAVQRELEKQASDIIDMAESVALKRYVLSMVALAGCGCFVRGMLALHFLPRLTSSIDQDDQSFDEVMSEIDEASSEFRKKFSNFTIHLVVYDSFRNPLQGWLLRHALTSLTKPVPQANFVARQEAMIATFSVIGRKGSFRSAAA